MNGNIAAATFGLQNNMCKTICNAKFEYIKKMIKDKARPFPIRDNYNLNYRDRKTSIILVYFSDFKVNTRLTLRR